MAQYISLTRPCRLPLACCIVIGPAILPAWLPKLALRRGNGDKPKGCAEEHACSFYTRTRFALLLPHWKPDAGTGRCAH